MKYLILGLLLIGCEGKITNADEPRDPLEMECKKVAMSFYGILKRCENIEVICYVELDTGGLQCKFKEEK